MRDGVQVMRLVSPSRTTDPQASAYAAWGVVSVVWGTTYLAIRIALEGIPPGLLAGMRFITAGTLLSRRLPGFE